MKKIYKINRYILAVLTAVAISAAMSAGISAEAAEPTTEEVELVDESVAAVDSNSTDAGLNLSMVKGILVLIVVASMGSMGYMLGKSNSDTNSNSRN